MEKHASGQNILYNNERLGPYPLEKLKHVEKPTNRYFGEIRRQDRRENALDKAIRGDYGEKVKENAPSFRADDPLIAAFIHVQKHLNQIKKNPVAFIKAPIPDDPRVLSTQIAFCVILSQKAICR